MAATNASIGGSECIYGKLVKEKVLVGA